MKGIPTLLRELHAFDGLSDAHLAVIAGCATLASFRDGDLVLTEGEEATTFFAIREGDVAIELEAPGRAPLLIETLHSGDVLGWSWLFAPYRVRLDARARGTVHAIAFDGTCLRGKCEADHELGFHVMRRFSEIVVGRLQATRIRLLDVYGTPAGP